MGTIKDDNCSSEADPKGLGAAFVRAGISRMLVVVILSAGATVFAGQVPLHHFDLPCQSCHEAPDDSGKVTADITVGCTQAGCHEYDPVLNHAVDVTLTGAVPAGMELDDKSRVTCLTCHESSTFIPDPNTTDTRFLDSPAGSGFCGSCHAGLGSTPRERSHWQFSKSAHLGDINPKSKSEKDLFGSSEIDAESRNCLSCHDDVTVTVPSTNESAMERADRWSKMADHPIGMDYSKVVMGGKYRSKFYNYPLSQDNGIRLFDGSMGCGSCHSLYSQKKSNLVMENRRSQLCKQCHNK